MSDESKKELAEFVSLLRNNVELLKPNFGFMFWQLQEVETKVSAEEFAEQGAQFSLEDAEDEIVAAFIAGYIKAWLSADDFNAASRMIASTLGMTADELLQTRQIYIDSITKLN